MKCSNAGEESRPALRSWKAPAGLPLMSMRGHLGVTFAQGHAKVASSGDFVRAGFPAALRQPHIDALFSPLAG